MSARLGIAAALCLGPPAARTERAILGKLQVAGRWHRPAGGDFFELWERPWYVNVKAYYELTAQNRPDGWGVSLRLLIPLSPAKKCGPGEDREDSRTS